jgi:hypothetical protein
VAGPREAGRLPWRPGTNMATVVDRYWEAVSYVHRAIDVVESASSALNLVDRYAARVKTEPVHGELAGVEARWLRSTNDLERAKIARDAELLADRTQEALPGAPQDRRRTNLWAGEVPTFTPATSYGDEVAREAHDAWDWTKSAIRRTADDAVSLGTWVLVAAGVLLTTKLWRTTAGTQRDARRTLNRRLERVALESEHR